MIAAVEFPTIPEYSTSKLFSRFGTGNTIERAFHIPNIEFLGMKIVEKVT